MLTQKRVERLTKPGRHLDSHGLYLELKPSRAKARPGTVTRTWLLRYEGGGKERWLGLGPSWMVPLVEAQRKAMVARLAVLDGKDPVGDRKAERTARALAAASKAVTFEAVAKGYIEEYSSGWSASHRRQFVASLERYVYPVFGSLAVADIDASLVLRVIEPLWRRIPKTAMRVRGRIESILDTAKARGHRTDENPARWRGHLQVLLDKKKIAKVHYPALQYAEVPDFLRALGERQGFAARAMELLILTAARPGEVTGAKWSEVDLANATWTVPAERMKKRREHRVPLSRPALQLLGSLPRDGDHVFVGPREGKPIGTSALLFLLDRMNRGNVTAHGMRSAFKTWATEETRFPRGLIEMSLAHAFADDETEISYLRGDALERRRKLMEHWSRYCTSPPMVGAVVVPMREASAIG